VELALGQTEDARAISAVERDKGCLSMVVWPPYEMEGDPLDEEITAYTAADLDAIPRPGGRRLVGGAEIAGR
jgi:hypothetical protein